MGSETIFDLANKREKVRQLEVEIEHPNFWDDNTAAQKILNRLNRDRALLEKHDELLSEIDDLEVMTELLLEENVSDTELEEHRQNIASVANRVADLEVNCLLSGKYDDHDCIFTIQSGAGGTDAQDWADMLFRMFVRWMEQNGYQATVVEVSDGDEAGIKSATINVKGPMAYGYLKQEIGVHRLVRISPFNANGKRQTSFAAVEVIPQLDADYADITIPPDMLKIDTYRASGAGGQHVNKTDSAVRITHVPTGLVAQSQSSRSQGSNKETAMSILKSRLIQLMEAQHKENISDIKGESKDIAWGNQIRSYVFHPYKMVKDHRTDYETSNVDAVMDGDLTPFIHASLRHQKS